MCVCVYFINEIKLNIKIINKICYEITRRITVRAIYL